MIFYLNRDSNHWNELFVTWLLIDARLFDYYCGNNWHNSYLLFSRSLSLCLSLSRLYSIDYSLTFFLLLLDDTLDLMTVQRLVARASIYYIIMVVFVVVVVEIVGPRRLYLPRVVLPSNKLVSKWRRRRPAVEAAAAMAASHWLLLFSESKVVCGRLITIPHGKKIHEIHWTKRIVLVT